MVNFQGYGQGDFDGNGKPDVLIDRITPGPVDGSFQTAILHAHASNGALGLVSDPTWSQIQSARGFPTNPNIKVGRADGNFDGFVDLILEGLPSLGSLPSYQHDHLILYASGKAGQSSPKGIKFLGNDYGELIGNVISAIADPNFYAANTSVTIRPQYGIELVCEPVPTAPTFWQPGCQLQGVVVGYTVQISGLGYHIAAPGVTDALNKIDTGDYSSGDPWWNLNLALKTVIGVDSFGFETDGTRRPTNYAQDDESEADEKQTMRELVDAVLLFTGIRPRELEPDYEPNYDNYVEHYYHTGIDPQVGNVICNKFSATTLPEDSDGIVRTIPSSVCTLENVFCWARRRPAPRKDSADDSTADDGETQFLWDFIGTNPIVTWVDPQSNTYVNQTLETHVFHDGAQDPECGDVSDLTDLGSFPERCAIVQRRAKDFGNTINMTTIGRGHNADNLEKALNEYWGKRIFDDVDEWIQRRLAEDGVCTND